MLARLTLPIFRKESDLSNQIFCFYRANSFSVWFYSMDYVKKQKPIENAWKYMVAAQGILRRWLFAARR
jgi:hypothetical protein